MTLQISNPLVLSEINPCRHAVCLFSSADSDSHLIYASGSFVHIIDFRSFRLRQVISFSSHLPKSRPSLLHGVEALCVSALKLAAASGPYVAVYGRAKSKTANTWTLHSSFTSCIRRINSIVLKGNDCLLTGADGASLYQVVEPAEGDDLLNIPRWTRRWSTQAYGFTEADILRSADGGCHIASFSAEDPVLHFYSSSTAVTNSETYDLWHRALYMASPIRSISFDPRSTFANEHPKQALYVSLYSTRIGVYTHVFDLETVPDDDLPSQMASKDNELKQSMLYLSHAGVVNCPSAKSRRVIQTAYVDFSPDELTSRISVLSILSNGHVHVSRQPSSIQPPADCPRLYQLPQEMMHVLANSGVLLSITAINTEEDANRLLTSLVILARSVSPVEQLHCHITSPQSLGSGYLSFDPMLALSVLDRKLAYGLSIIKTDAGDGNSFLTTSVGQMSNTAALHVWQLADRGTGTAIYPIVPTCQMGTEAQDDISIRSNADRLPRSVQRAIESVDHSSQWWAQVLSCHSSQSLALSVRLFGLKDLPSASFTSENTLTGLRCDEKLEKFTCAIKPMSHRTDTTYWSLAGFTSLDRLLLWDLPIHSSNLNAVPHQPKIAYRISGLTANYEVRIDLISSGSRLSPFLLVADHEGHVFQVIHTYNETINQQDELLDLKDSSRVRVTSFGHILKHEAETCSLIEMDTQFPLVALLYLITTQALEKHLKLVILDLRQCFCASGIVCLEKLSFSPEDDEYAGTRLKWSANPNKKGTGKCDPFVGHNLLAVACNGTIKIYGRHTSGWWREFTEMKSEIGPVYISTWSTLDAHNHLIYGVYGHLFISPPILNPAREEIPMWHPTRLVYWLQFGELRIVAKIIIALAAALKGDTYRLSALDGMGFYSAPYLDFKLSGCLANDASSSLEDETSTLSDDHLDILLTSASEGQIPLLKSEDQHALTSLARQFFSIQRSFSGIDILGCQYLLSLVRQLSISDSAQRDLEFGTSQDPSILLAYHSSRQALLVGQVLENVTKHAACSDLANKSTLNWKLAREIGLFLWIRPRDIILSVLEIVAQQEYQGQSDNLKADLVRDPAACSIFYMALRKKRLLLGLWRVAYGHPDRPHMLKFLANDFEEQRWKTAAQKNAFALISRQRFRFAASFFLLADRLQDAVNVCVRQLGDWPLGVAIARAYEGDGGPVFQTLLKDAVIPQGFLKGNRWLLSWAFDLLGQKDLSCQSSLDDIARSDALQSISGNIVCEQPGPLNIALVIAYHTLRDQDHIPSPGLIKEYQLAFMTMKHLTYAGCYDLAFRVARAWNFSTPRLPADLRKSSCTTSISTASLESPEQSLDASTVIREGIEQISLDAPAPRVLKQIVVPEFDLSNF